MALSALDAILFHEFAHAALGHLDPKLSQTLIDQERAADLYSATYMSVTGGSSLATIYNFSLLAMLDDRASATHMRPSCTYANAAFIAAETNFATIAITSFPNISSLSEKFLEVRRQLLADFAEGRRASLFASDSPPCNPEVARDITRYRVDLLTLARFQHSNVDQLPDARNIDTATAMLSKLLALPMITKEGDAIRAYLVSLYIRDYYVRTPNPLPLTKIIIDTMSDGKALHLVSKDFGRLLGTMGIIFFHELPQKRTANEDNKALHQALEGATRYNPDLSEAWAVHGLLYLRESDCSNALPKLRNAVATASVDVGSSLPAIIRSLEDQVRRGECKFPT